ncbi:MAG TPA: alanine--tRNA ligase-related protein [Actinocrinis sp.]|nr:alanine--tRNA ligase-related protein [Actinocrinis sp.]
MDSKRMDSKRTVETFLDFYRERGHERVGGTSLLPPSGDPVLFTTSGMHPLTPYLLGRPHPQGRRLVSVQRCLRTTDLDEVGDETHLTVFQMLGSWSLGDYDGEQSIRWGYDLLRDGFGVDPGLMHVTVFGGDEQVGPDVESLRTWGELGVPVQSTSEDNWWSNGPSGPCGPDTEIFVWTGDTPPSGTPTGDPRWVEVWNHVSMRYHRHEDGRLEPLPVRNVDTGLGLERLVTVLQRRHSVFDCDVFEPWNTTLPSLWPLDERSSRIVVDHLRSGIVVVGDGVQPSNTGRGYVLRRLVRRTLTTLWRDDPSRTLTDLPPVLIEDTLGRFGQPCETERVRGVLLEEEQRFSKLLKRGREVVTRHLERGDLDESGYRYLFETHGLPRDLVDTLLTNG